MDWICFVTNKIQILTIVLFKLMLSNIFYLDRNKWLSTYKQYVLTLILVCNRDYCCLISRKEFSVVSLIFWFAFCVNGKKCVCVYVRKREREKVAIYRVALNVVFFLSVVPRKSRKIQESQKMNIGTRTRCFRPSKRFDLLEGQWEQKRLQDHKNRIGRAEPRIDFSTPASASYQHIRVGYRCRWWCCIGRWCWCCRC